MAGLFITRTWSISALVMTALRLQAPLLLICLKVNDIYIQILVKVC